MAIYQRGNNWYIYFTFKGQKIRESIGPFKKNASKGIDKKKTEIIENKYLDIRKELDPIKFHHFAKEYLQWAKANKKLNRVRFLMPNEFQNLLSNCDDFLKPIVTVAVHTGMKKGGTPQSQMG